MLLFHHEIRLRFKPAAYAFTVGDDVVYAHKQVAHGKRLGYIVVGTCPIALVAVFALHLGRKHYHRKMRIFGTPLYPLRQLNAVHDRHHHVCHHHVECSFLYNPLRFLAVRCRLDLVMRRKQILHEPQQLHIVLHKQHRIFLFAVIVCVCLFVRRYL